MSFEFKLSRMLPITCAALTFLLAGYYLPLQADDKPASGSTEQSDVAKEAPPQGERTIGSKSVEGEVGKDGRAATGGKSGLGPGQWPPGKLRPVQEH